MSQRITPNLWFDTQAEEAAAFYVSVFPDSRVLRTVRYGDAGPGPAGLVMTVEFELDGMTFVAINGGPQYTFSPAVSLSVDCADQDEVDRYWELLTDGGTEVQCGWLTDRFGVSWQVVPAGLPEILGDPDPERARRAAQAMFGMRKLDLAALRAAADAVPVG